MRPLRRLTLLTMLSLLMLEVGACKKYERQRRPRATTPAAPVAEKEELPPPPPAEPLPPPPPAPPPRAETPGCGPLGKGPHFVVQGVDPSDTLNVRAAPDPKSEVLGQLAPNTTGVVDLGRQQQVGPSTWRKVRCGALIGWVNGRFLDPQDDKTAGRL